ncbi:MAG: KH domain-containing protein [Chloroflexi bacterium]|nr:KH domain-containing protein [Chloroflexota bacterium]
MGALIEYLARAIAEDPDQIEVEEVVEGDRVIVYLRVSEDDKGRIIGRDGRVANAMRSLLHVASMRAGVDAALSID